MYPPGNCTTAILARRFFIRGGHEDVDALVVPKERVLQIRHFIRSFPGRTDTEGDRR